MKKYDLHIHTRYSECSAVKPELLLKIAKAKGLDGIAVTDHNAIKGALLAKKLNKDKNFEVIIGSEIETNRGEMIGLYLQEEIKPGNVFDVIDKIKEQGGLIIIPHPFECGIGRKGFRFDKAVIKKIAAVECFNARTSYSRNKKANSFADRIKKAKTAGSDAHFSHEVGRAVTIFDRNLRDAILKKKTKLQGTCSWSIINRGLSVLYKYPIGCLIQKNQSQKT